MTEAAAASEDLARAAEVAAAACLATDLAMGFPFEHGLRATLMAMRLAELLEVDRATAAETYYVSLLTYAGCTADLSVEVELFGGSLTEHVTPVHFAAPPARVRGVLRALPPPDVSSLRRSYEVVRRLPKAIRASKPHFTAFCEVAEMLAVRLGLTASLAGTFRLLTDRWDGQGPLKRATGDAIPLALRISHVARDVAFHQTLGGNDQAVATVGQRAGGAFDPEVAKRFVAHAPEILAIGEEGGSVWEATLAAEPDPQVSLHGAQIDRALAALGSFADLVSPYQSGHSAGVAALAGAAAERCGLASVDVVAVRRAGLVHDVGRVAVDPRIWLQAGALTADDREQVRLHAYHAERVCASGDLLAPLGSIASWHHERLDGSGYHRGLTAASFPLVGRILATADGFHAMTEPRPHRDALTVEAAAVELSGEANRGQHDPDVVTAVLEVVGQPPPRLERPAGLTEREAEVVGLLARGLLTKQLARELGISVKTADRHIQHAYRKMDVSSRAAATLFAVEYGLVAWGELPIPPATAPR